MQHLLRSVCCLVLAAAMAIPAHAGPSYDFDRRQLEAVMDDLKAWLPGAWDSFPQVWYERTVAMPEGGEHEYWHRSFALIDAPQVGEVVFYGQINIGGRDGPIMGRSQVLYRAIIDEERNVVAITGQPLADPERFENLHERPELWGNVHMRDETAVHCDFIWRRDGRQLVGVLAGKAAEFSKYGPGTCNYISGSGDEFFADAEWVLSPDELWTYDINTIRGVQFIGRRDRTHTRLYRASPYSCSVRDAGDTGAQRIAAHDRGFSALVRDADDRSLEWRLLRAWYPGADGFGLDDELRLLVTAPGDERPLAQAAAAPLAPEIGLSFHNLSIVCRRAAGLAPMAAPEQKQGLD